MTKKLLTIKDIEIKNVGQQVRSSILKDYSSIESFYHHHNIQKPKFNSFKSYLSMDEVSDTFQVLIVNLLHKSWKEIVKTDDEQIRQHVENITENINLYKQDTDLHMLLRLKTLSKPYKDLYATTYRNIGIYHYNTQKYNDAVANILMAIELLNDECSNYNTLIAFYIDLLTIYFREGVLDKTLAIYNEVIPIVNKVIIEAKTLYQLWYIFGQLFKNGKNEEDSVIAKTMFQKALKLATTNVEKGNVYLQIALLYKNEKDYAHALKYYELAQGTYEKEDCIRQSIVLNNLAELYRVRGETYRALLFIEEALHLTNKEGITDKKLIYLTTKLEIIEDKSTFQEIMREIGNILLSDLHTFNKKFIITSLDTIINIVDRNEDTEIIKSLASIVEQIINKFITDNGNHHSDFIHSDFVKLLENNRNKLVYLYNKKKEVTV
jgi:tetratricopeptide (TPR) repeat protein